MAKHCFALLLIVLAAVPVRGIVQQPAPSPADALFRQQKWKEAAAAYEQELKVNPKRGQAWFQYAYAVHATGDFRKASSLHEKAAAFPAFRVLSLYNLACAKAMLKDSNGAFKALEQSIDAGFGDKAQLASDSDLASLRQDRRWQDTLSKAEKRSKLTREFDFWVGSWVVMNPQGAQVGTSRVDSAENGALIIENWDGGQGRTGKSINFVDPADGKWHQIWVDQGGTVTRFVGEFKEGAMRFKGKSHSKVGISSLSRMTFTPLDGNKVRQFIETSTDGGKTWSVYFDGVYAPKR